MTPGWARGLGLPAPWAIGLCRPLWLSENNDRPKTLQEEPEKRQRRARAPSRSALQHLMEGGGPPPCEQQSRGSHPCSPPATLCPIPHATLGPGPRELTWRKLPGPPGTDARGPDARWPSRAQRQLQSGPHAAQGLTPRGSCTSICHRKDVPPAIRDVGDEARRPR